jgi:hypothetical protein
MSQRATLCQTRSTWWSITPHPLANFSEVGKDYQKAKIKLYLLQASAALISALEILQSKESAD